jgi:hypothetical protein
VFVGVPNEHDVRYLVFTLTKKSMIFCQGVMILAQIDAFRGQGHMSKLNLLSIKSLSIKLPLYGVLGIFKFTK